jgi:hypothetical protein
MYYQNEQLGVDEVCVQNRTLPAPRHWLHFSKTKSYRDQRTRRFLRLRARGARDATEEEQTISPGGPTTIPTSSGPRRWRSSSSWPLPPRLKSLPIHIPRQGAQGDEPRSGSLRRRPGHRPLDPRRRLHPRLAGGAHGRFRSSPPSRRCLRPGSRGGRPRPAQGIILLAMKTRRQGPHWPR